MIDRTEELERQITSLSLAPAYVRVAMLIALVTLLRILKSPSYMRGLDTERAKARLFTGINLCKLLSASAVSHTAARAVTVLNQLWHSSKAFRKSDGSEYTTLRIRSRLALSPVVDAVLWWRDEFDSQYRAMGDPSG